jgi:hypothetical protein
MNFVDRRLGLIGFLGAFCVIGFSTAAQQGKSWERVSSTGQMQLVWIAKDAESDRRVYDDAISALCRPKDWCGLLFWSDRQKMPMKLPMSDAQASAQVAAYTYNPRTNFREFLLNCRINPNPNECFK